LSYKFLDHATDAFIEVTASNLEEAFTLAGNAVIETTLEPNTVQEKEEKPIKVTGKDLDYLLFNWIEALVYLLITEGFAARTIKLKIEKKSEYTLDAKVSGEPINLSKHHFKVEIKAPTFHEMKIEKNGQVFMRFLIDL